MDPTRIHLLITHLPVFGLFLGVLAFLYGQIKKEKHVKILSSLIVVIAAAGGIIAFQTGEFAEETVEHMAGVAESAIHEHEEAAELTVPFYYGLVIFSLLAIYFELKEGKLAKLFTYLVLLCAVASFALTARTASLGGKIRHTEITNGGSVPVNNSGEIGDDD